MPTEVTTARLSVLRDLTVNGTLTLAGSQSRSAEIAVQGGQTLRGNGTILFSDENLAPGQTTDNRLVFDGILNAAETLVIAAGLTLEGNGRLDAFDTGDVFQILGEVRGSDGGRLTLTNIANAGERFTVDASVGEVAFAGRIADAVVAPAAIANPPGTAASVEGPAGGVTLLGGTALEGVTLEADAHLSALSFSTTVLVQQGLTLDGTLLINGSALRQAELNFRSTQTLDGTGEIVLGRENVLPGQTPLNALTFSGLLGTVEVLTIGAGITISGSGSLNAFGASGFGEDSFRMLGTFAGTEGGQLVVRDIRNDGDSFFVDASEGSVGLVNRIATATIEAAPGNTGVLDLLDDVVLEDVDLAIDSRLGATINREFFATIEKGLTVDATLTIAGTASNRARLTFEGEQSVDGTGEIVLSRDNAFGQDAPRSDLVFSGALSSAETLELGVAVRGTGVIDAFDAGDTIDVTASVTAEGGRLELNDLTTLGGTLGASAGSTLAVGGVVAMTEQASLSVGLSGSGGGASAGLIDISSDLVREGVLALDLAPGFDAAIGDTFTIVEAGRFLGAFDGFDGFEIGNGKAFVLDETLTTLTLRVATTAQAQAGGFLSGFTAPPPSGPAGLTPVQVTEIASDFTDSALSAAPGATLPLAVSNNVDLVGSSLADDARLAVTANSNTMLFVQKGLALDGADIAVSGDAVRLAEIEFQGEQSVTGTGSITLDQSQAGDGERARSFLDFNGVLGAPEILTLGAGIDVRGSGDVFATDSGDALRILGDIVSTDAGTGLLIQDIDQGGGTLSLDASSGRIVLLDRIANAVLDGAVAMPGQIELLDITLDGVDISIDTLLDARLDTGTRQAAVVGGLTLDETLTVAGSRARTAEVRFFGEQTIDGTGTIELSSQNARLGSTVNNLISFDGATGASERFTVAETITVRGSGTIQVVEADTLRFLGTLVGDAAPGVLRISGIDNEGDAFTVNASQGEVALFGRIKDARVEQTGSGALALQSTVLENVVLAARAELVAAIGTNTVTVENGLTLIGTDLSLSAGTSFGATLRFSGEQALRGSGSIVLSDVNAPNGAPINQVIFDGVTGLSETFEIRPSASIRGQGTVRVQDTGDRLDLQGRLAAEGGVLNLIGINALGGTLAAEAGSAFSVDRAFTLESGATFEVGVASGVGGIEAGELRLTSGGLTLGGTLDLDVAPGFSAAIGEEARIALSASGLDVAGAFTAITGANFAGPGAFALVNDGQELFLRVVPDAQAGQVFDRADFPVTPRPFLPDTTAGEVINAAFAGGVSAAQIATNEVFDDVRVQIDVAFSPVANFSSSMRVANGMTVNGTFEIDSSLGTNLTTAFVGVNGTQTIDGTGTIQLTTAENTPFTQTQLFLLSQTTDPEVLTFGTDLTVRGTGQIGTNTGEDRLRFLGDVVAEDGVLDLVRVDQDGGTLSLDAAAGGTPRLSTLVANAVVETAAGVDTQVRAATLTSVEFAGAGRAVIDGGTLIFATDLGVSGELALESVPNTTTRIFVQDGLDLDGQLTLAASQGRSSSIEFDGTQAITGTGTLLFSRQNVPDGAAPDNVLFFDGQLSEAEVLTIGAGITIAGSGRLDSFDSGDAIRFLGTAEGRADGVLSLADIDNDGDGFSVDARLGTVRLSGFITEAAIDPAVPAAAGAAIELQSGLSLTDVDLGVDTDLIALAFGSIVRVRDGLTVDATLSLNASENRTAELRFEGGQTLDGTGEVVLGREAVPLGLQPLNRLEFDGTDNAVDEAFVIGPGIEVRGTGVLDVFDSGDTLVFNGTLEAEDGTLTVESLDDTSTGTLRAAADGVLDVNDASLDLAAGATLEVGIDAEGAGFFDFSTTVDLGGTLALDVEAGFAPSLGDTFEIAQAGTFSGSFAAFDGFDLAGNLAFALNQDADSLELEVTTDALAAAFL
ncbi:MAG: hypothetical protein AAGI34_01540 [Pseudomonadota bacterium]